MHSWRLRQRVAIAIFAKQAEIGGQIRRPAFELGKGGALVVRQRIEHLQIAPPRLMPGRIPERAVERRAHHAARNAVMRGEAANEIAPLIDGHLHRRVLFPPGMAFAVPGVGVAVGGEENRRSERRKADECLHAPLAQARRQGDQAVVVAHRGKKGLRPRVRRFAVAPGDRGGCRLAFEREQKPQHLAIECGNEALEFAIEHEPGMIGGKRRHHGCGIEHLHEAHAWQVVDQIAVAVHIVGEGFD
jgi:hypothetical protein